MASSGGRTRPVGATNIQLLRSWRKGGVGLQTFSSSGAGEKAASGYKHSAPPELGKRRPVGYKHSAPRSWRKGGPSRYVHSAPPDHGIRYHLVHCSIHIPT